MRSKLVACVVVAVAVLAACTPTGYPADDTTSVTVSMDPNHTAGFFALPWPNEIRKQADGSLDLAGIPTRNSALLSSLINTASSEISDFGTVSAIYLRFSGPIDPSSLPTPSQTLSPSSPIQLVALDGTGDRFPVVLRVEPADGFRTTNLVSLLPYPGHPLRPATRYSVVVTTGIRSADGTPSVPSPLIAQLDSPFATGRAPSAAAWGELRQQRDEARAVLAGTGTWSAGDLVGFTSFRTQDSQALMKAVAAAVDRFDVVPPSDLAPTTDCDQPGGRRAFAGHLTVPRFQEGLTPTTFVGGRIDVGADGVAVVQGTQSINVGVSVPCSAPPASGWAIQTYIDGTGAGVRPAGGFGRMSTTTVIGSIAPLYSPDENGSSYNELLFYNFLDPAAARTNPIQQAADNLVLLKALERLQLPGSLVGSPVPVTTDANRVVVTGHSQGAQTVSLVATFAPEVDAIVTSSAASGQYNSVSYRSDVRDGLGLLIGDAYGLDIRSPVVQIVQTLLDVDEASNFPTTGHWLDFVGLHDGCLPFEASRNLAGSQHLAIVNPQWPSIFGDAAQDPVTAIAPVTANSPNGSTRVLIETPGGHRVASGNLELAGAFIDQVTSGLTPTVPVGPYAIGPDDTCAPRYGDIGNND